LRPPVVGFAKFVTEILPQVGLVFSSRLQTKKMTTFTLNL